MLVDTLSEAGGKMATKALQAEVRDAGHSWDAAKRLKKRYQSGYNVTATSTKPTP